MDILYTLGKGSTWQDNELRYSLRSIDKYGINVNRIYIVGDWCPGFVDRDKVTFIRCHQPYTDKFKNILYSVLYACENSDIAEDFLLSSDDHFYMEKTDFDAYPYWLKNLDLPDAYCLTGYAPVKKFHLSFIFYGSKSRGQKDHDRNSLYAAGRTYGRAAYEHEQQSHYSRFLGEIFLGNSGKTCGPGGHGLE